MVTWFFEKWCNIANRLRQKFLNAFIYPINTFAKRKKFLVINNGKLDLILTLRIEPISAT